MLRWPRPLLHPLVRAVSLAAPLLACASGSAGPALGLCPLLGRCGLFLVPCPPGSLQPKLSETSTEATRTDQGVFLFSLVRKVAVSLWERRLQSRVPSVQLSPLPDSLPRGARPADVTPLGDFPSSPDGFL